jgi:hypothetical protein
MANRTGMRIAMALMLLAVCLPAFAHHGTADYDPARGVTEKVRVTDFKWTNPHCQIEFDFKDDKGSVQHWTIETPNPSSLRRLGWILGRESLNAGDMITITFFPAKNGAKMGFFEKAVLADGTVLKGNRRQPDSDQ